MIALPKLTVGVGVGVGFSKRTVKWKCFHRIQAWLSTKPRN